MIEQRSGQPAPRQLASIEQLDRLAEACVVEDPDGQPTALGFLPDPRRLWAWGVVFGGAFYDADTKRVTAADPANVEALQWMASYRHRFGPDNLAAFRQGDQSLPFGWQSFGSRGIVYGTSGLLASSSWNRVSRRPSTVSGSCRHRGVARLLPKAG